MSENTERPSCYNCLYKTLIEEGEDDWCYMFDYRPSTVKKLPFCMQWVSDNKDTASSARNDGLSLDK